MDVFILALIAVFVNIFLWLFILFIQTIEAHLGHIPKRQRREPRFLYFQDWYTTTLGDWVGISLLDAAFVVVLASAPVSALLLVCSVLLGLYATIRAHWRFSAPGHVPDSGYPAPGRVSMSGLMHLLYFFIQTSIAACLFFLAILGELPAVALALGLAGGTCYVISFMLDYNSGLFFKKLPF